MSGSHLMKRIITDAESEVLISFLSHVCSTRLSRCPHVFPLSEVSFSLQGELWRSGMWSQEQITQPRSLSCWPSVAPTTLPDKNEEIAPSCCFFMDLDVSEHSQHSSNSSLNMSKTELSVYTPWEDVDRIQGAVRAEVQNLAMQDRGMKSSISISCTTYL